MFTINGIDWNLRLVRSHSPMLMRSDGTYTFGMTDRNTRDIYISNMIHGNFYDRVLCHELCHPMVTSFFYFWVNSTHKTAAGSDPAGILCGS